jgi:hypothetical protein
VCYISIPHRACGPPRLLWLRFGGHRPSAVGNGRSLLRQERVLDPFDRQRGVVLPIQLLDPQRKRRSRTSARMVATTSSQGLSREPALIASLRGSSWGQPSAASRAWCRARGVSPSSNSRRTVARRNWRHRPACLRPGIAAAPKLDPFRVIATREGRCTTGRCTGMEPSWVSRIRVSGLDDE